MPHPGPKGRCSVNIPQLILSIVDVAAAIFLIAVVLLQSGKSAGLSGAIAGVADTFMAKNRAKTWDAKLAKLTKWVAIGFVVITFVPPVREGGFCIFRCRMRQNYGTTAWADLNEGYSAILWERTAFSFSGITSIVCATKS